MGKRKGKARDVAVFMDRHSRWWCRVTNGENQGPFKTKKEASAALGLDLSYRHHCSLVAGQEGKS